MSNPFMPPVNPYQAPQAPNMQDESGGEPWSMDYFGGISAFQQNPNWLSSSFLCGLCAMIPIVGAIVIAGFAMETAEIFHRSRGTRYVDFNFNRFSDYLGRGIGPFLVGLVSGVIQWIVSMVLNIALGVGVGMAAQQNQGGDPNGAQIAMFIFSTLLGFGIQVVFALVAYPMQIRSGMASDIGEGFNLGWAFDFAAKNWFEIVVVCLVSGLIGFGVGVVGILTCCIGLLPGIGFVSVLNGWWTFQLYRMHLSRGGQPIPLKPMSMQV